VTVADDVVFVGSFNLSHSGEMNAENVLELHDPQIAERLAAFIDEIRARYPAVQVPAERSPVRGTPADTKHIPPPHPDS
jgi:phosphatidylserine/phosphatidylglycerophosphate/cardiolipin synthase-like enzyme